MSRVYFVSEKAYKISREHEKQLFDDLSPENKSEYLKRKKKFFKAKSPDIFRYFFEKAVSGKSFASVISNLTPVEYCRLSRYESLENDISSPRTDFVLMNNPVEKLNDKGTKVLFFESRPVKTNLFFSRDVKSLPGEEQEALNWIETLSKFFFKSFKTSHKMKLRVAMILTRLCFNQTPNLENIFQELLLSGKTDREEWGEVLKWKAILDKQEESLSKQMYRWHFSLFLLKRIGVTVFDGPQECMELLMEHNAEAYFSDLSRKDKNFADAYPGTRKIELYFQYAKEANAGVEQLCLEVVLMIGWHMIQLGIVFGSKQASLSDVYLTTKTFGVNSKVEFLCLAFQENDGCVLEISEQQITHKTTEAQNSFDRALMFLSRKKKIKSQEKEKFVFRTVSDLIKKVVLSEKDYWFNSENPRRKTLNVALGKYLSDCAKSASDLHYELEDSWWTPFYEDVELDCRKVRIDSSTAEFRRFITKPFNLAVDENPISDCAVMVCALPVVVSRPRETFQYEKTQEGEIEKIGYYDSDVSEQESDDNILYSWFEPFAQTALRQLNDLGILCPTLMNNPLPDFVCMDEWGKMYLNEQMVDISWENVCLFITDRYNSGKNRAKFVVDNENEKSRFFNYFIAKRSWANAMSLTPPKESFFSCGEAFVRAAAYSFSWLNAHNLIDVWKDEDIGFSYQECVTERLQPKEAAAKNLDYHDVLGTVQEKVTAVRPGNGPPPLVLPYMFHEEKPLGQHPQLLQFFERNGISLQKVCEVINREKYENFFMVHEIMAKKLFERGLEYLHSVGVLQEVMQEAIPEEMQVNYALPVKRKLPQEKKKQKSGKEEEEEKEDGEREIKRLRRSKTIRERRALNLKPLSNFLIPINLLICAFKTPLGSQAVFDDPSEYVLLTLARQQLGIMSLIFFEGDNQSYSPCIPLLTRKQENGYDYIWHFFNPMQMEKKVEKIVEKIHKVLYLREAYVVLVKTLLRLVPDLQSNVHTFLERKELISDISIEDK